MASTQPSATASGVESNGSINKASSTIAFGDDDLKDDGKDFDFRNEGYVREVRTYLPPDPTLYPNGARSLSSIGLKSFWLGFTLSSCLLSGIYLAWNESPVWRFPAFFACLSVFHFLEYYTTARYNTPVVKASSFLFNNGMAYNIAHTMAAVEIVVSNFLPRYQSRFVSSWSIAWGMLMVFVGQGVRSMAMAQAGTNFNHLPVQTKKEDHVLVTHGVYGLLRHPSYFGFFWWAVGTQVLVGNKFCVVGYLLALWKFFHDRIIAEERTLVKFFGTDYEEFRKRTGTGIPFIR